MTATTGDRGVLRDGGALSTSAVLTGLIGMLCWVLAAATVPQAQVGTAAIQVSSTVLVLLGVLLAPVGAGLVGPAIGFLLAQTAVAAAVLPGLLRHFRPQRTAP